MHSKTTLVAGLCAIVALSACSSKSDINETNFTAAVNEVMKLQPPRCLPPVQYPVTASLSEAGSPVGFLDAGQALTKAGLLVATPVTARESVYRQPGFRFSPSADGLKQMALYRDAPGLTKGVPRFCYGHDVLNKVTRWEGFEPVDGRKSMRVYFTYSVPDAAEWARRSDVQSAFPVVAADMSGTFEPHLIVSLIDGQWKVVNR